MNTIFTEEDDNTLRQGYMKLQLNYNWKSVLVHADNTEYWLYQEIN